MYHVADRCESLYPNVVRILECITILIRTKVSGSRLALRIFPASLSAPSLNGLGVIPPLHVALAAYHEHQVAKEVNRRRDVEHNIPLVGVPLRNKKKTRPPNNDLVATEQLR